MEMLHPHLRNQVGESPLWNPQTQALWWVDIEGFAIHRWADGQLSTWQTAERPACLALHPQGGLLVGMDSGLFHLQFPEEQPAAVAQLLAAVEHPAPHMRFNDGRCDRQGRFWAGTMVRQMSPPAAVGSIYRFDRAGLSAPQLQGLVTANGLAFSPDGRTAYWSDSHPSVQRIWQAPLHDDGSLGPAQLFVDMAPLPGRPDGAAVDADGGYWICGNDAGLVHRFAPNGRLDRSIAVPVSKPAMCSFGGAALDELYITSIRAAQPRDEDDRQLGGGIFVTRPGVCGLAEVPWCGLAG